MSLSMKGNCGDQGNGAAVGAARRGVNVTLKIALCPAESVSGRGKPFKVKPVALTVA